MNTEDVQHARRARLAYQTQILQGGSQPTLFDDAGGPAIDKERAPFVLRAVGVPPALSGATLAGSKFDQVDDVRAWLVNILNRQSDEHLALLLGKGCNYTAAALLRNAVKRGRTVAWYTWHDFTSRYTDRIGRTDVLRNSTAGDDVSDVLYEMGEDREEDFRLQHVYDMLAIVDFDIDDVRDFAIPEICALLRHRMSFEMTTVFAVPSANSEPLEDQNTKHYGGRGALLRLFDEEGRPFDGR